MILTLLVGQAIYVKLISAVLCENCGHWYYINIFFLLLFNFLLIPVSGKFNY